MKRDLGPKKEGVEYIEFIDDLKKGIIAISAILNTSRSATLYFGANDSGRVVFTVPIKYFSHRMFCGWDYFDYDACPKKFFVHGLIYQLRDYLIEEIERAISPKPSVKCTIENLGNWSNVWDEKIKATEKRLKNALGQTLNLYSKRVKSLGDFGVIKFCVKGGKASYSAYGQRYIYKNGKIRPLKNDKLTLPELPKQVISIGPKTKQSTYIETFTDLRKGLESASRILHKYPYATLYFGVKDDGTIIDPRSEDETKSDLTGARKRAVKCLLGEFTLNPSAIFGVEKIGEAHVARVIILPEKYEKHLEAYNDYYSKKFYEDIFEHKLGWKDIENRTNYYFICPKLVSQRHRVNIFEAPIREVTFERIKELLTDKKYKWDNFETEFGSALFDKNGRYSLLASLIGDNVDAFLGLHLINLGHVKVEMPKWKNSNHCLFDWLSNLFDNISKANDVWTGMIDDEEVKLQQFNVDELRNAFLCTLVHNDWTTLHIPIIEITDTSISIVFRAATLFGWEKRNFIPKENEPFVKLMKIVFALDDEDLSFCKIRKKYGIQFVHNTGDGYSHIKFPIRVRL